MDFVKILRKDIVCQIATFLEIHEALHLLITNKKFSSLLGEEVFWFTLFSITKSASLPITDEQCLDLVGLHQIYIPRNIFFQEFPNLPKGMAANFYRGLYILAAGMYIKDPLPLEGLSSSSQDYD